MESSWRILFSSTSNIGEEEMSYKNSKAEFLSLVMFMVCAILVLTNGFTARIWAQNEEVEVYEKIEPIGEVLAEILDNYVYEPDLDRAVEGALMGIMSSLDRNSSYISIDDYKSMQEDTRGEFDGIGVSIKYDEISANVWVFHPVPGAPAAKAGIKSGDYIVEVDGVDMSEDIKNATSPNEALGIVSKRIKGPRGTNVNITVSRKTGPGDERERINIDVKRGKIPLNSLLEVRLLDNGIGYVRISDFKNNTADDLRKELKSFEKENFTAMVLDLRWNPGGLLSASREVCELFLPKNSLVTYTRGRAQSDGQYLDDMKLYTQKQPVIPEDMPVIVLVSRSSASSSEIVTGALQFYKRAIVIGEKTYGKGSVQTVIPLSRPEGSALRLTTALYYTPAEVTIDQVGILPDVEVEMDMDAQIALSKQMNLSMNAGDEFINKQNHGPSSGNTEGEEGDELVNDLVLDRAIEIIRESPSFERIIEKYHRAIEETQKMASDELREQKVR